MCGLSGIVQRQLNERLRKAFIAVSNTSLYQRGPDHFGWLDLDYNITLTHSRLSIIDLQTGDQPMVEGGDAIVFNGEIYNYQELRDPNFGYATHSDTEVLLHGLKRGGLPFLEQADGMFAFAWYSANERTLTLARDMFGIKPMYYFFDGERFAFSSRLQPLMLLSQKEVDPLALGEYYAGRACHAPRTIFKDIHELKAGEALVFDLEGFTIRSLSRWMPEMNAWHNQSNEKIALTQLEEALDLSVRRHLIADVPVATFLSGGVDSSLLTAMAAKYNPNIAAFSIGFSDERYDEANYAAAVCRRYRLRHHVRYCDHTEFMQFIESWPEIMDDVVADPSAVMLALLSQYAREMGYKVVLSGEGADELFGGYNQYYRFLLASRIAKFGKFLPFAEDAVKRLKSGQSRYVQFARQATKDPYFYGTGRIFEPYLLPELLVQPELNREKASSLAEALRLDLHRRLPDDMLTRTDRATMHASIETRVPFLTRYVWDVASSLSPDLLIRGKTQKYLLKKLAEKYVPHECLYRRKVGFDLPLAGWLRGSLKPYMLDNLANSWQNDFLRPGAMQKVIDDHLAERNDNADKIWAFLLLENNVRRLKAQSIENIPLSEIAPYSPRLNATE